MDDTSKYLIHASIAADGVVERSDVVGAIFGQTEGLLGDELDLRDLQQSSKVGRIDVEIASENGRSYGHVTIASSLDKVETAILAASLETITRVGPCQAAVEVTDIEDVREAKRREVVDRAKELLAGSFDESVMTSSEILEEVRESVRVENITEFADLPAGPRVADSDAIIVVEGRADVLTLLKYGVKNAVAVEGTNVPDAVATLTQDRTVTAFLDGDRGGELILRELAQVGDVDYVAFAPEGRSVEDLVRAEVMSALREKIPWDRYVAENASEERNDGVDADPGGAERPRTESSATVESTTTPPSAGTDTDAAVTNGAATNEESAPTDADDTPDASTPVDETKRADSGGESGAFDGRGRVDTPQQSLYGHVRDVVGTGSGNARLLDADLNPLDEVAAEATFDAILDLETPPYAVILDAEATQKVVDVAAQRGVEHLVARSTGEYVKKPVGVRVRTAEQLTVGHEP